MKKMTVVLGVIGFALVSLGGELTVTGKGVVKRRPDKMKITFTVSAEDKDMTVARRMFEEHTATLASVFAAAGISTNEVVKSGIDIAADYNSGAKISSFSSSKFKYKFEENYIFVAKADQARLDRVKSALLSCKVVSSLENSFELFDSAAARNEARTLAVKNARDVAQRMAKDACMTLCEIDEIVYEGKRDNDNDTEVTTAIREYIELSETVCIKWKIK